MLLEDGKTERIRISDYEMRIVLYDYITNVMQIVPKMDTIYIKKGDDELEGYEIHFEKTQSRSVSALKYRDPDDRTFADMVKNNGFYNEINNEWEWISLTEFLQYPKDYTENINLLSEVYKYKADNPHWNKE